MPTLKPSTINASFFPGTGAQGIEDHRVENVAQRAERTGQRELDDDEETLSGGGRGGGGGGGGGDRSGVSTRRSSMTRVEGDIDGGEKYETKTGKTITILHFERGDPEDPLNWSRPRKWLITFLLCMMTFLIGLSTSAYSNTISGMTAEYGVSNVAGQVGMLTFNMACAVAPLFLAPLCELIGRREVYLTAYACFVTVFLLLALGKNIGSQIVGRLLSGLFGSCGTILVGGTLADIWTTKDRSVPMSCFTFVAIFGTIAAPSYCGWIDTYLGWRWIEWIHMIANGLLFLLEVFFLRETRGAKILSVRAKQLRKETGDPNIRAPTWGITFLFLSVIPLTFQGNHGWSEGMAGLPYISLMIGCFIGFATGLWADRKYDAVRAANGGVPIPEYRLWGAMFFAGFLPIGLFIFSFTQFGFVHWIAPCIALVLIILGIYHIFLAVYNYTSDSYGEMSSSAIAGQGFMRNAFAASTPLFANQMFKGMGYQYAGLLLALITLALAPLPFVLFRWGAQIRDKSRYAVTEVETDDSEEKQRDRPALAKETLQTGTLP